jgi:VanZ family protein
MSLSQHCQLWFRAFFPPLAWAVVIFLFSSQSVLPSLNISAADFVFKKGAHMFVYGVLYFLLWRGFTLVSVKKETHPQRWALPMAICLIYALTDEYHQSWVSGRTATFRDVGFDMLGASISWLKMYGYV